MQTFPKLNRNHICWWICQKKMVILLIIQAPGHEFWTANNRKLPQFIYIYNYNKNNAIVHNVHKINSALFAKLFVFFAVKYIFIIYQLALLLACQWSQTDPQLLKYQVYSSIQNHWALQIILQCPPVLLQKCISWCCSHLWRVSCFSISHWHCNSSKGDRISGWWWRQHP